MIVEYRPYDYVPSGNEKGHAPYDISMILTVHASARHGDKKDCARAANLRSTVGRPADVRLALALNTECTCGAEQRIGVPGMERTSLRKKEMPHGTQNAADTPAG